MKCPKCEHVFPLTWRRYLSSPFGVHSCPACGQKSRFRMTFGYFAFLVGVQLASDAVIVAGAAIALGPGLGSLFGFTFWVLVNVTAGPILMFVDKNCESRFRTLWMVPATETTGLTNGPSQP